MRTLMLTLVAWMICTITVRAGWIDADVIQIKHDRPYFSVGNESLVYPNSEYIIVCDDDTLIAGYIEESTLGVSYSEPVDSALDLQSLMIDSCRASVETAGIDSISQIRIAAVGLSAADLAVMFAEDPWMISPGGQVVWGETSLGNRIRIAADEMYAPSGLADVDAVLSFAAAGPPGGPASTTFDAPFVAILIPNLDKKANRGGILTTSLYCRIGDPVMPHLFKSGEASLVPSLIEDYGLATRFYPYDPSRGHDLLQNARSRSKKIKIDYTTPSLRDAAVYLADVLSRDRVSVELSPGDDDADLLLALVPVYRDEPERALGRVLELLRRHDPRTDNQRESLELVEGQVDLARQAGDSLTARHFAELAERTMMTDLGVFPLFRPLMTLQPASVLTGVRLDCNGRLDPTSLTKLRLPAHGAGEEPR